MSAPAALLHDGWPVDYYTHPDPAYRRAKELGEGWDVLPEYAMPFEWRFHEGLISGKPRIFVGRDAYGRDRPKEEWPQIYALMQEQAVLAKAKQDVVDAAIYAVNSFIPHPPLTGKETLQQMIQWGAIRHLHDAVARMTQVEKEGLK